MRTSGASAVWCAWSTRSLPSRPCAISSSTRSRRAEVRGDPAHGGRGPARAAQSTQDQGRGTEALGHRAARRHAEGSGAADRLPGTRSPPSPVAAASRRRCWPNACCWSSTPTARTPGSRPSPPVPVGGGRPRHRRPDSERHLRRPQRRRYGGRGVLIYWHVEKKSLAIHSQLINRTASEVAAMIEGAMRHGTTMDVEANYTDSHGQSEIARSAGSSSPSSTTR
ncbi:Tn3 family transposase [Streptomyces acidiscabies]|nr:Tn3 family transposase [Streptomyces acidiscabies]